MKKKRKGKLYDRSVNGYAVDIVFLSFRDLHLVFLYVRKYRRHRFILRSYRNYRVQIFF